MKKLKRGILRLGTTKSYARYFMPFLISGFHQRYSNIRIHLNEGSSLEMIHGLLDFQNEVAIIAKAEDHPDVFFMPFSQEELVMILAPEHPLARKRVINFMDLAEEPIIMKETGSGTRRLINELFARHNRTPDVLVETSNTEFIKQLVQRGDGVSFVVREAVAVELKEKNLATVPVKDEKLFLDMSIAYLKDQHLSHSARAFLDILGTLVPADMTLQGIGALMTKMLAKRK